MSIFRLLKYVHIPFSIISGPSNFVWTCLASVDPIQLGFGLKFYKAKAHELGQAIT